MKPHLTPDQLDAFGEEMDALRRRVLDDLGEDDASYIRGIVRRQQQLEVLGRALFERMPIPSHGACHSMPGAFASRSTQLKVPSSASAPAGRRSCPT